MLVGTLLFCSVLFVAPLFAKAETVDVSSLLEKLNGEALALQTQIDAALNGSSGSPDKATLSRMLSDLNSRYEEINRMLAFQPGVALKARRTGDNALLPGTLVVSDSDAVDFSWATVNNPDSCSVSASPASTGWTGERSGGFGEATIPKGSFGNSQSYSIVCTKTDATTGTIYRSLPSTVTVEIKPVSTVPPDKPAPQVIPHLIPGSANELSFSFSGLKSGARYVLKRKEGSPDSTNTWTEVSKDITTEKQPAKDGGLTPGKEYSYALFMEDGTVLIPDQTISSQSPNLTRPPDPIENTQPPPQPPPTQPPPSQPPPTQPPPPQPPPSQPQPPPPQQPSPPQPSPPKTEDSVPLSGLTVTTLLGRIQGLLNTIIPFIIGLTVFVILWGIFTYVTHAAEEEKRAEARQFIIWGIIGVFFMLSIWGFVNLLLNSFDVRRDIQEGDIPKVPTVVGPK